MSTGEEMCISYIYYYPIINMSFCLASPLYDQISKDSEKAFEQLKDWNWNDKHIRQQFQELVNNSTYNTICNGPIKLEVSRCPIYLLFSCIAQYVRTLHKAL